MKAPLIAFCAIAATSLATPAEPEFRPITIDSAVQIGYGVAVADVDGDRAPDILLADKKQFVWYRNPGVDRAADPAAWKKHLLAENLTVKDNVCIAARDLDGDGRCEIAVGAEWNPADTKTSGAVFYLLPPADRTQPWEPVKFPAVEPTTHRMRWVKLSEKDWGLVVVPLHGRGNQNGQGAPVKVLCYRKPADPRTEWPAEVVSEALHMTHNFDPVDVTPEAGASLWLGGKEGVRRIERERGEQGTWLDRGEVSKVGLAGVGEIRAGHHPAPGAAAQRMLATVEPMHGNSLVAYVAAGDPATAPDFQRQLLTEQLADGHALACGDVLGTGRAQIVLGWRGNPQKPRPVGIKLFTPPAADGGPWRESFIDDNEMACEDLVLADLNADGKLDVVASGRSTHNLKVYLNETPAGGR